MVWRGSFCGVGIWELLVFTRILKELGRFVVPVLLVLACLVLQNPASASKRVALVIGNADYKTDKLLNPVNDARAIGAKLSVLGFQVTTVFDLKRDQIGVTLEHFLKQISPGDSVVFFYAGHGIQFDGRNYLLATDANLKSQYDVTLNSIDVGSFLRRLDDSRAAVKIIFLDACRNNPFAKAFRGGGSRGLARMGMAPSGTLISFATRPGGVAADGEGEHGLYTAQLLKHLETPGMPVEQVLKRVAVSARQASQGAQEPWIEGSLVGDFVFKGTVNASIQVPVTTSAVPASPAAPDALAWSFTEQVNSAEAYNAFLQEFPKSAYAGVARLKLRLLNSKAQVAGKSTSKASLAPTKMAALKPVKAAPKRVPGYLPYFEQISAGKPLPIDGLWMHERLGKRVRIKAGHVIAVDSWTFLFVHEIRRDMVIVKGLEPVANGRFYGDNIGLAVREELTLNVDGTLSSSSKSLIPYNAKMTPIKLTNAAWFKREVAKRKSTAK